MSIISLFPELQAIYRDLRHLNSATVLRYSASTVTLYTPTDKPLAKQTQLLLAVIVLAVVIGFAVYTDSYFTFLWAAAVGLWQWYKALNGKQDLSVLRFQNTLVVAVAERQIHIEYGNPYYQQQVMPQETIVFADLREVGVRVRKRRSNSQLPDYGQLYFTLADGTLLYVTELDDERIANNLAYIFQRILGLPTQPWREKPWYST